MVLDGQAQIVQGSDHYETGLAPLGRRGRFRVTLTRNPEMDLRMPVVIRCQYSSSHMSWVDGKVTHNASEATRQLGVDNRRRCAK